MPIQGVITAVAIAVCSVALGAALGLLDGPKGRAVGPSHTFALVAAIAVVAASLLPAAMRELGLVAIVAFAVGLVAPHAVARLARRSDGDKAGLELSFVGLLVHQLGDGLALGAYVGPSHAGHLHIDVLIAIAAHTVPVAAVVVAAFLVRDGMARAIARASALALSSVIGIAITELVPHTVVDRFEPWVSALVAGLLIHVVTHSVPQTAPNRTSRVLDLVAILGGIGIAMLGRTSHHGDTDAALPLAKSALDVAIATAPMLLLGLVVASFARAVVSPIERKVEGNALVEAGEGAARGPVEPMCEDGTQPKKMSSARAAAMWVATSQRLVESFAIGASWLGLGLAGARAAGAMLVSVACGLAGRGGPAVQASERPERTIRFDRSLVRTAIAELDASIAHQGPLLLVGLAAATYVLAALPDGERATTGMLALDVALAIAIVIPVHASAVAVTPLAALLVARGLPPIAALSALLVAPASAALLARRRQLGVRRVALAIAASIAVSIAVAALATPFFTMPIWQLGARRELGIASVAAIALLFVRSIHREGLRAWLGSIASVAHFEHGDTAGTHAHCEHGHAHGARKPRVATRRLKLKKRAAP